MTYEGLVRTWQWIPIGLLVIGGTLNLKQQQTFKTSSLGQHQGALLYFQSERNQNKRVVYTFIHLMFLVSFSPKSSSCLQGKPPLTPLGMVSVSEGSGHPPLDTDNQKFICNWLPSLKRRRLRMTQLQDKLQKHIGYCSDLRWALWERIWGI